MSDPGLLDKIKARIFPNYLYPGQFCQPTSNLKVAIIHKVSTGRNGPHQWNIMDYITIEKGSLLKYLGTGSKFKIGGTLPPSYSLFETVDISADRLSGTGDVVALSPQERKFVVVAPQVMPSDAKLPTYFTAEDAQ